MTQFQQDPSAPPAVVPDSGSARGGRVRRWVRPLLAAGLVAASVPVVILVQRSADAATVDPAAYYAVVARHSGQALTVGGGSTADGASVVQETRTDSPAQQWRFVATTDGHYKLLNRGSGKALDVFNRSVLDLGQVSQWTDNGGDNQQWRLVDVAGGYVQIVARHSGKALDVFEARTTSGTNVVQFTPSTGANQQWTLARLGGTPPTGGPTTGTPPTGTPPTGGPPTGGPVDPPAANGPYRWRNVEMIGGGFVTGIIYNQKHRDVLYARTDMGGAYRWNPATSRWIPITDWVSAADWTLLGIESMATDPVDPRRLYIAAGTYTNDWSGNGAILRSTDYGNTFQRTNMPFKMGGNESGRSMGERMMVDPNNNAVIYFGTRLNGMWRSTDYGATWAQVGSFPVRGGASSGVGISFVTFDPTSGSAGSNTRTIYAGVADSGTHLYRSTDAGASWQAVGGQQTGMMPHHGVLASDGMLYLSYGNGPGPNGMTAGAVRKLNTRTGAWTTITPATGSYGYAGLTVDARNPNVVMVTTMDQWWPRDEIWRSTNGGASWTALGARGTFEGEGIGHWMGDIEIDPFNSDRAMYVTGNGIWGTDNLTASSNRWVMRAHGLEQTALIDLIAPPGGASLISAMGDIGGYRHDDLTRVGVQFSNPRMRHTTGIDYAERVPNLIARVGVGGPPHGTLSTDGGTTWTPFGGQLTEGGSIAISADGATFVWAPDGQAARYSRNRGGSWTTSSGLPNGAVIKSDRSDANTFYALVNGTLYASTNGGASFSARSSGHGNGKLEAVPGRAGDLWIATSGGLLRSTNGGSSFARIGAVQGATSIGFGRAAPGESYPAAYMFGRVNGVTGVYRSTNAGSSWTRVNDDRNQWGGAGHTITGDPDVYGRVYVGTNGRGVMYGDPT
ncbi:MAG TPA: RICIN domain-containing protein [Micromonosporaceae bacterium]|nr:RICIN domain-containing protein [Micromonosporaceae bacterium]